MSRRYLRVPIEKHRAPMPGQWCGLLIGQVLNPSASCDSPHSPQSSFKNVSFQVLLKIMPRPGPKELGGPCGDGDPPWQLVCYKTKTVSNPHRFHSVPRPRRKTERRKKQTSFYKKTHCRTFQDWICLKMLWRDVPHTHFPPEVLYCSYIHIYIQYIRYTVCTV